MNERPLGGKMANLLNRLRDIAFPDGEFIHDLRATYFALRLWIGGIGVGLPFVLVIGGMWVGVRWDDMTSISAFYWLRPEMGDDPVMRVWFVGALWAIGFGLIIYEGYGRLEDWLLNFAGGALLLVALFPMPWPPAPDQQESGSLGLNLSGRLHLHYVAAVTFFILIALVIWLCARTTLHKNLEAGVRKYWSAIYGLFAFAMILVPAAAIGFAGSGHSAIGIEAGGVIVFGTYWFVKTYELKYISHLEPTREGLPRMEWRGGELRVIPGLADRSN